MVQVLEIEDRSSPKPFLGGWRDVARDVEYHDAASQTPLATHHYHRRAAAARRRSRKPRASVLVQTSAATGDRAVAARGGVERAVQADPWVPLVGERCLVGRSAEELRRREAAALTIQCCYRAYRRRKLAASERRAFRKHGDVYVYEEEEKDGEESQENASSMIDGEGEESQDYRRLSHAIVEQLHILDPAETAPRDARDFAVLRDLLDRWAVAEELRIRETYGDRNNSAGGGADKLAALRIAAHNCRLRQEIEILRAIERSRGEFARRRGERARARFLDELAKPIELEVSPTAQQKPKQPPTSTNKSLGRVQIETLNVQRARDFRDMYEALMLQDDDDDCGGDEYERIELLFALKKLVARHTCAASSNLESLVDQELFLIASRVEPQRMKHLRARIRLGFLRLARAALRHDGRIKDSSRTQLCSSCGRLRRLEAFETDHRARASRACVDCARALRPRRGDAAAGESCLEIYERMLKELRRSEAARPDAASSLAFAIGPKALRYLVSDIWHGRSAISECRELEQLRLIRLDPTAPWSPWNTLLATRREARMHEALARDEAAADAYDAELLRKFRRMNLQARLYFESMAKASEAGHSL